MYHENSTHKRAGITTLLSNKIDFRIRNISREKEPFF